ncbi:SpoIVB peptidase S55 domain-containing protein [Microlunatus antarcticus]|uniref:Peptidase S55 domain-containing protein n=1 Tax=Microlunatus antarcticus TaxID=53388 RepID=A0A7W5JYV6_9ACTN|nr:SpoIVB peptidase S55 domain-containing protein [Microlunatus antarcticus]MBB3328172.1 hypothetical protein [Microlunatus antarcticus]
MADTRRHRRRLVPAAGAGVLLALVAGSMTAPAQAAPQVSARAVECPTAYPLASVAPGLRGEGQTVVTGTTPQPFVVDVLGVLEDGLGAGRDMIIVKVSDVAGGHVVDQGSGIWAGMSGSPVYVDGKLLGSVSYGFTTAPSPIGGLTPAADMLDLLDLKATSTARSKQASPASPKATLSTAAKTKLAAAAGVATPKGTLQQLVSPLAVSGIGTARLDKLQAATDAAGWSVKAYAAGRRSAPTAAAPTSRPQAGGNFAATLSYGDLTAAAIGTTTYVCGDQAIAFGHPFNLSGPASYGANDATSIAIVTDNTLGSFKMANVGPSFGTVDQDRTAGIRADLTAVPSGSVVSTRVKNLNSGKVRDGSTTVVDRGSLPGLLPDIVFSSQDAVFDEWGDGAGSSSWTISGTRAGGKTFAVTRTNRWASRDDVTIDPAFDVASAADALLNNDFEDVRIDKVAFANELSTKFDQLHITRMRVSVNGGPYVKGDLVQAKVGDKLTVRVDMSPFRSTTSSYVKLRMTVPKSAKGQVGTVSATGGVDLAQAGDDDASLECLLIGQGCASDTEGSLDGVISQLTSAPRNDAVTAQLVLEPQDDESDDSAPPAAAATKLQKLTVTGQKDIEIAVR